MATLDQYIPPRKNAPRHVTEFSGKIRSIENFGLEKGDIFFIPINYKIWEKDLNGVPIQYIEVFHINGEKRHFYPAVLRKVRTIYNDDGTTNGQRVATDGTAAKIFQSFRFMKDGLNALRGKYLKISDIRYVRTMRYGTTSLMNAQIPTIDIVK